LQSSVPETEDAGSKVKVLLGQGEWERELSIQCERFVYYEGISDGRNIRQVLRIERGVPQEWKYEFLRGRGRYKNLFKKSIQQCFQLC
jgi:hypothetical protein